MILKFKINLEMRMEVSEKNNYEEMQKWVKENVSLNCYPGEPSPLDIRRGSLYTEVKSIKMIKNQIGDRV